MKEETLVKMKNVICYFFGHKVDKTVLAYNIKSHDTTYDVKIYEVSKCSRCNKISVDDYKRRKWSRIRKVKHRNKKAVNKEIKYEVK